MRISKPVIIAVSMIAVMGAAGAVSYAVAQKHDGSFKVAHRSESGQEIRGHRGHWRGKHRGRKHQRMLERFDTNGDQKLTQEELDQARNDLLKRHDANSDGNIDLNEFEKLWLEVRKQRVVRGFQRLDADGDAKITSDEFLKPFANVVERFDRNDDGVLDREDRRKRFGKRWRHREDRQDQGSEEKPSQQ
ncbi:MAG: EF-hand domain-containing protein [Methyloligellaceae bacterium]